MKRNITIAGITGLIAVIGLVFFLIRNNYSFEEKTALTAVPENAALLAQIENTEQLHELISRIEFAAELESFETFKLFANFTAFVDTSTLFRETVSFKLKRRPLLISLHCDENGETGWLINTSIKSKQEENDFLKTVNKLWNKPESEKHQEQTVFCLDKNSYLPVRLFVSCKDGIITASNSNSLIKASVEQRNNGLSINDTNSFMELYKKSAALNGVSIYVNFARLPQLITPLFASEQQQTAESFAQFAGWCELDLETSKDNIALNGFLSGNSNKLFTALFNGIHPQSPDIYRVAPLETKFLMSYSFDSRNRFKENFRSYLQNNDNYQSLSQSFADKHDIDFDELLFSFIEKEIALVYSQGNEKEAYNRFLVFNTEGQAKTLEMLAKYADRDISPTGKLSFDNQTEIPFYGGLFTDMMKALWGNIFPDVPCNVFTFHRNYLIFSENEESLKSFIYSTLLNKNLSSYPYFSTFTENFSYHENFFLFVEIPEIFSLTKKALNPNMFYPTDKQSEALKNFYGLGLQFSSSNNLTYTTLVANYTPHRDDEPHTVWQSRLDSVIIGKPSIVENHNTSEKEILVQDALNNLYLINSMGRVLWKKPLDGAIMSDIFQIDFYMNNKLQYLFNTSGKMYLIDRNGNHVAKYPFTLPEKATNGLSVYDYEHNKDYRIFLALADNRVYLFDKHGSRNPGWQIPQTEGAVTSPVQFFTIKGKDYVVFGDRFKNYILDRRGQTRIQPNRSFIRNSNSLFFVEEAGNASYLATTTPAGELARINIPSGETSITELAGDIDEHFFSLVNTDGGKYSYLVVTENELRTFTQAGKEEIKVPFDHPVKLHADLYRFSTNDIKFGVVEKEGAHIHLIGQNGQNYRGFPLKGNSRFSIGFLQSSNYKFNLIVGGEYNFLNNYAVE
ncbi:MAG: hypothetical protein LBV41_11875 [Cytophagaceae bacterium]|jgi:hypothetical protein|nr:hypothetical protein [Cytophagaceae bacterium]